MAVDTRAPSVSVSGTSGVPGEARGHVFPATRHSAVAAVGSDDPAERARSFDVLVRAYWKPVYKHLRLKWHRPSSDAGDLTQGFFAQAFERRWFVSYDRDRALFRTYLKSCLDRYVGTALRDERRKKRGGDAIRVSLDFEFAEAELARTGPANASSVDAIFDAEWTRSLFATAVEELEALCTAQGKERYALVFRRYVLEADGASAESRLSYAELAREVGASVSEVTNYLAWTRREFRRLVLETLREITATEEEWRSEARAVLGVEP